MPKYLIFYIPEHKTILLFCRSFTLQGYRYCVCFCRGLNKLLVGLVFFPEGTTKNNDVDSIKYTKVKYNIFLNVHGRKYCSGSCSTGKYCSEHKYR